MKYILILFILIASTLHTSAQQKHIKVVLQASDLNQLHYNTTTAFMDSINTLLSTAHYIVSKPTLTIKETNGIYTARLSCWLTKTNKSSWHTSISRRGCWWHGKDGMRHIEKLILEQPVKICNGCNIDTIVSSENTDICFKEIFYKAYK